jgi:uncharacterized phage-associated protein
VGNDRLANTVLFLLRGSPRPGLTKLLKLLYFSDYLHYQGHLKTITGMSYVAQRRGPVIKDYEKELKSLEKQKLLRVKLVPVFGYPNNPKQEFEGLADPAPDAFAPEELATMTDVLARFGRRTGEQLSEMTHEERGPWKLVWDRKAPGAEIPYALFRWFDNFADKRDLAMAKKRERERAKRQSRQGIAEVRYIMNIKSQLLPIVHWHTTEKLVSPHSRMIRELYLMAIVIRRDWTQDDTTNKQDHELVNISNQIKRVAKRLHMVFDASQKTRNKARKTVVQPRKKTRKKTGSKTNR